jgi:hypothetical protein
LALPGSERTIRGISKAELLIIDEAARVPDETLAAVRPMLATARKGGRIIALTTAGAKMGWFYTAWTTEDYWQKVRISVDMCPRITEEFLREEKKALQTRFAAEYLLEFMDDNDAVWNAELIDRAFDDSIKPLWG